MVNRSLCIFLLFISNMFVWSPRITQ
jgi:hypothetical protein